jgi:MFS family permease
MVNLAATTMGQMSLTLGDANGYLFFVIAAIVYCMALLPTALSATTTPTALVSVSLDVPGLWRNSPIAIFGVLMVGISNSTFGTLAAVYGARVDLTTTQIALFASIPILAGAAAQLPIGILSDRHDRRIVLIGIAAVALLADAVFVFSNITAPTFLLINAAVFGAAIYAMYPVIVAHANDHAPPGTFIQVSGGLLLVFGIGSMIGPTAAGVAITSFGPQSLFMTTGVAHILLLCFAVIRLRARAAVATEKKGLFRMSPIARASTPETAAFAMGAKGESAHLSPPE